MVGGLRCRGVRWQTEGRDGAREAGEGRVIKGMGCLAREAGFVLALIRRLYGMFSGGRHAQTCARETAVQDYLPVVRRWSGSSKEWRRREDQQEPL